MSRGAAGRVFSFLAKLVLLLHPSRLRWKTFPPRGCCYGKSVAKMIDAIFDRTSQVLEKSMDLRMMRNGLLASNIANVETPHYRAVDIDFKATMANLLDEMRERKPPLLELERTDPRHFSTEILNASEAPSRKIVFAAGDSFSIGNDSNSVNLAEQLGRLEQNALQFSALSKLMGKKLGSIKNILESTARF